MKKIKMPQGVKEGDGKIRISVVLDKDVFQDVCTFGLNHKLTFSDAINNLVQCGILDMKDAEEFDKTTESSNDSNKPGDSRDHR